MCRSSIERPQWAKLGLGLVLVAPFASNAQVAADAAPPDPAAGAVSTQRGGTLEEVTVTAQKREQSIKEVGMSITAIGADQLRDQSIRDVGDLSKVAPSFIVSRGSYGTPVYSIRGVGYNEQSLAASPTVSVYMDEVPYAYPALTKGATLDIGRVEILKGPQGTLYGQNATGGAINYIAAKPTDTLEGGIEADYGRFDAARIDAFISGPLSETVRGRVALAIDEGGAWQRSYTRDDELGDVRMQKMRVLLDWTPSDAWFVALNVNGWRDRSDTPAPQLIRVDLLNPPFASAVPLVSSYPAAPNDGRAADWDSTGPALENDEEFYQGSLRVEYSASDALNFTSLTAYSHYDQNNYIDNDGMALENNSERQRGTVESFSQELRASGVVLDDRLHWLLGAQYARDKTEELVSGYLPYSTSAYPFTAFGLPPFRDIAFSSNPDVKTQGIFTNLEYQLHDTVVLHAGARYTESDIDYTGCLIASDPNFGAGLTLIETAVKQGVGVIPINQGDCTTFDANFNPGLQHLELNENNVSWRAGLDWKPLDGTLLYVSATKGFKAGGFPTLPATGAVQLTPVTQESLLSYELGFKTDFGGRPIELDGAVFYYDYKDKQLRGRILDPTGVFGVIDALVNVPQSAEKGAELSLKWRPVTGLTLDAAVTYLDPEVTESFETYDPYTGNLVDFEGYGFPATPEWTAAAGTAYEWDLTNGWIASVGANYRYQTEAPSAFVSKESIALGFPSLQIDSYGLLDVRAGLEAPGGSWKFQVYANNVTDEYYWNQAIRVYDTSVRYAGKPRTWGVRAGYRF